MPVAVAPLLIPGCCTCSGRGRGSTPPFAAPAVPPTGCGGRAAPEPPARGARRDLSGWSKPPERVERATERWSRTMSPQAHRMRPSMPPGRQLPPRPMAKAEVFEEGDHVVYPTHGVGKVERIATEEIAGHKLELIHITFEENRMTLRVPVSKARTAGLRKLATRKLFDEALAVLKGRARVKRTMWSRRAQEYEAKINSGDPLAIAEVVRDLHRNAASRTRVSANARSTRRRWIGWRRNWRRWTRRTRRPPRQAERVFQDGGVGGGRFADRTSSTDPRCGEPGLLRPACGPRDDGYMLSTAVSWAARSVWLYGLVISGTSCGTVLPKIVGA